MSVSWQLRRGLSIQPGQTTITAGCSEAYLAVTLRRRPANSPLSGIRIRPTRVTSEAQRAASSSFICLHNAAKDSGLRRGGAALLTGPAAPLRPSGLVVKRSLEKKLWVKHTGPSLSRLSDRLDSSDFSPLSTRPGETPQQKPFICCTVHAKWLAFLFTSCFVSRICLSVCPCNYKSVKRRMVSVQLGVFLRLPSRSD